MFIIQKVPKSIAGRTEGPRGPHAARVFETPALNAAKSSMSMHFFMEFVNNATGLRL